MSNETNSTEAQASQSNPFTGGGERDESGQIEQQSQVGEQTPQQQEVVGNVKQLTQEPQKLAVVPSPQSLNLSPEGLQQLVAGVAKAVQPQPQAQQQPQMSQEEFRKATNYFEATVDHLTKLGLPPEAAPIFNELLQGIARQSLTMAKYMLDQRLQETSQQFTQQLTPLQQYYNEQNETKLRSEFMEKNPDLKGWEPLLETIYTNTIASGRKFANKEEAFDAFAKEAKRIISTLPAAQSATQGGNRTVTTPTPSVRRMSTVATGGQGGAGSSSGGAKSTAQTIFG